MKREVLKSKKVQIIKGILVFLLVFLPHFFQSDALANAIESGNSDTRRVAIKTYLEKEDAPVKETDEPAAPVAPTTPLPSAYAEDIKELEDSIEKALTIFNKRNESRPASIVQCPVVESTSLSNSGSPLQNVELPVDKKNGFSEECELYMDKDGNYGEYGKLVLKALDEIDPTRELYHNKMNISKLCPNYHKFSPAEKDRFIIFKHATIADFESSCIHTKTGKANPKARGLYQLEFPNSLRKTRNEEYCKPHDVMSDSEFKDPEFQITCATAMFADVYLKKDEPIPIPNKYNYWQEFKKTTGSGGRISDTIKTYPGCFDI